MFTCYTSNLYAKAKTKRPLEDSLNSLIFARHTIYNHVLMSK